MTRFLSHVIVRLDCTMYSRAGSYRLTRMADKYGAQIEMSSLLEYLAGGCKYWRPRHPGIARCGALFPDLDWPWQPDIPLAAVRLRVVK
jgi:hypothetical protein